MVVMTTQSVPMYVGPPPCNPWTIADAELVADHLASLGCTRDDVRRAIRGSGYAYLEMALQLHLPEENPSAAACPVGDGDVFQIVQLPATASAAAQEFVPGALLASRTRPGALLWIWAMKPWISDEDVVVSGAGARGEGGARKEFRIHRTGSPILNPDGPSYLYGYDEAFFAYESSVDMSVFEEEGALVYWRNVCAERESRRVAVLLRDGCARDLRLVLPAQSELVAALSVGAAGTAMVVEGGDGESCGEFGIRLGRHADETLSELVFFTHPSVIEVPEAVFRAGGAGRSPRRYPRPRVS